MTNLRLAAIQQRAQRTIARADSFGAAVTAFVADIYASELVAAENDEHQREIAQRAAEPQADTAVDTPSWLLSKESLRTSAIFWRGEVKRLTDEVAALQAKVTEIADFKPFADAGIRLMPDEEAKSFRDRVWGLKEEKPR